MPEKKELVVKSNRLIEASYRLNLVEQQIVLFAICRSREEQLGLSPDTPLTIAASDFAAKFGANEERVYSQLKEATATLYDRSVTLYDNDPNTGNIRVTETRWISDKSYIDGAGRIQITFAPKVIPFITRLESEFTAYRLEKIGKLSSTHAVRLYELLAQYLGIGHREIELAWLRRTLGLTTEYKAIKDFKKYVIDLAVRQINEHSDLNVRYTQRKTGRVVTHLIFTFSLKAEAKQETEAAQPPLLERDESSPFRLAKVPIPPKTQIDYLKARAAEEIELCIERANEYGAQQEKAGKAVRYGALYRKAVAEGWHGEKARQKAEQAEADAKKAKALKQAAEAKRAKAEQAERREAEAERSAAWFAALPDAEKEAMGRAYVAESNPFDAQSFKRKGYAYTGFQFFAKRKWQESESRTPGGERMP